MAASSGLQRIKLIGAAVIALLTVVVMFQNRASIETHILFITVTMPRFVLLLTTTLIGFALGVLVTMMWLRKR